MQNSYRRPSLFWPVLLIVLGLDMFIGRRSLGGAMLVLLLSALIVAAALTWAALRAQRLPPGQTQGLIQSYHGAETASVKINFDVGELDLSALTASDYLMEGEAKNGPGESVEQTYSLTDGEGRLTISQQRNPLFVPDLSGLNLTALDLASGVGQTSVVFPSGGPLNAKVKAGVGDVILTLPADMPARITVTSGLTGVNIPARFSRAGNVYT